MTWGPLVSKFSSTQRIILHSRQSSKLLQDKHRYCNFSTRPARTLGTTAYPPSGSWKSGTHDVASVLRAAAASPEPASVTVAAVVRTVRKQKKHTFVKLGDGSTTKELQVLLSSTQSEGLTTGASVEISGTLEACPPGLEQTHELHASKVTVIGASDAETYPIQKKYHTSEFLRTLPHLRLRTPWNGLLARLRSEVDYLCSEWFRQNDFIRTHPPVITSSDCEGAGEVFTMTPASAPASASVSASASASASTPAGSVDHFFRMPKFLTVSSQLHLEAYTHAHRAVWCLGPTFRAEKSITPRHLSEFYMLEAELQTTSLSAVMDVVEHLIRHIATHLSSSTSSLGTELLSYNDHTTTPNTAPLSLRWEGLLTSQPWQRITYTEAITHLQHSPEPFFYRAEWGAGLSLEHEKYLVATLTNNISPLFVTDYPAHVKPFYMLPSTTGSEAGQETCASFDLLLPEMAEVAGGSLRQHDMEALQQAMLDKGVSAGNLDWYVDLRRHGSVPHGGFGLGFDRLLGYLAGEANVREVVPWPRWVGRCDG